MSRVVRGYTGLCRVVQGYAGLRRVTQGCAGLRRVTQGYTGSTQLGGTCTPKIKRSVCEHYAIYSNMPTNTGTIVTAAESVKEQERLYKLIIGQGFVLLKASLLL